MIHLRVYTEREGELVGDVVLGSLITLVGGEIIGKPFRPASLPHGSWAEMVDTDSGQVIGCGPVNATSRTS